MLSTWSNYQTKFSPKLIELININLADKLPQSQLQAVNPNLTPFPVLGEHGGVVSLFLHKESVCINLKFQTPKYLYQINIEII